jgi:aminoglycoside phosphotransferase (APT) family kinase protein
MTRNAVSTVQRRTHEQRGAEGAPYDHGAESPPARPGSADSMLSEHALRGLLEEVLGDRVAAVRTRPLVGGASRELWMLEADLRSSGAVRFVLRRDPEHGQSPWPSVSLETEFRVLEEALSAGIPVPKPVHFEPRGGRLGTAGYVMEYLEGEAVAPRILRDAAFEDARARLPRQLGEALARIHALPLEPLESTAATADDSLDDVLSACERVLRKVSEPLPATEACLRWLQLHRPTEPDIVFVHGDFRMGNLLVGGEGLRAVLDWELAHPGVAAEDIAFMCVRTWRFGRDRLRVGGLAGIEELLTAYEEAGGRSIAPEEVRYWELFGNVKWAIGCASQAHLALAGHRRDIELAALGRRICQAEWDMLQLLGELGR